MAVLESAQEAPGCRPWLCRCPDRPGLEGADPEQEGGCCPTGKGAPSGEGGGKQAWTGLVAALPAPPLQGGSGPRIAASAGLFSAQVTGEMQSGKTALTGPNGHLQLPS